MEEELEIILKDEETLDIELETDTIEVVTSDYERLQNLPSINNVPLIGNKQLQELGISELSNSEIEELLERED